MGHTYFLLLYMGLCLLFVSLLQYIQKPKWVYILTLVSLLAGNAIIYPEHISQGWSSSLASMPYWSLRKEIFADVNKLGINEESIYTFFPFGNCADDIDLSGNKHQYAYKISEAKYVIASNICNLDDKMLEELEGYELVTSHRKGGVWLSLYRITP